MLLDAPVLMKVLCLCVRGAVLRDGIAQLEVFFAVGGWRDGDRVLVVKRKSSREVSQGQPAFGQG